MVRKNADQKVKNKIFLTFKINKNYNKKIIYLWVQLEK